MKIEIRLQDLVLYLLLIVFVFIACMKYVEVKSQLRSLGAVNYKAIVEQINANTKDISALKETKNGRPNGN